MLRGALSTTGAYAAPAALLGGGALAAMNAREKSASFEAESLEDLALDMLDFAGYNV
jgi:hypothetical protein